jgi:hypothetical protein
MSDYVRDIQEISCENKKRREMAYVLDNRGAEPRSFVYQRVISTHLFT